MRNDDDDLQALSRLQNHQAFQYLPQSLKQQISSMAFENHNIQQQQIYQSQDYGFQTNNNSKQFQSQSQLMLNDNATRPSQAEQQLQSYMKQKEQNLRSELQYLSSIQNSLQYGLVFKKLLEVEQINSKLEKMVQDRVAYEKYGGSSIPSLPSITSPQIYYGQSLNPHHRPNNNSAVLTSSSNRQQVYNSSWLSKDVRGYDYNQGFVIRFDYLIHLPINFQFVKIKYGFFQKGDELRAESETEILPPPEQETFRTNKVIILNKENVQQVKPDSDSIFYCEILAMTTPVEQVKKLFKPRGWSMHQLFDFNGRLLCGKFRLPFYAMHHQPQYLYNVGLPYLSSMSFCFRVTLPNDSEMDRDHVVFMVEEYQIDDFHQKKQNTINGLPTSIQSSYQNNKKKAGKYDDQRREDVKEVMQWSDDDEQDGFDEKRSKMLREQKQGINQFLENLQKQGTIQDQRFSKFQLPSELQSQLAASQSNQNSQQISKNPSVRQSQVNGKEISSKLKNMLSKKGQGQQQPNQNKAQQDSEEDSNDNNSQEEDKKEGDPKKKHDSDNDNDDDDDDEIDDSAQKITINVQKLLSYRNENSQEMLITINLSQGDKMIKLAGFEDNTQKGEEKKNLCAVEGEIKGYFEEEDDDDEESDDNEEKKKQSKLKKKKSLKNSNKIQDFVMDYQHSFDVNIGRLLKKSEKEDLKTTYVFISIYSQQEQISLGWVFLPMFKRQKGANRFQNGTYIMDLFQPPPQPAPYNKDISIQNIQIQFQMYEDNVDPEQMPTYDTRRQVLAKTDNKQKGKNNALKQQQREITKTIPQSFHIVLKELKNFNYNINPQNANTELKFQAKIIYLIDNEQVVVYDNFGKQCQQEETLYIIEKRKNGIKFANEVWFQITEEICNEKIPKEYYKSAVIQIDIFEAEKQQQQSKENSEQQQKQKLPQIEIGSVASYLYKFVDQKTMTLNLGSNFELPVVSKTKQKQQQQKTPATLSFSFTFDKTPKDYSDQLEQQDNNSLNIEIQKIINHEDKSNNKFYIQLSLIGSKGILKDKNGDKIEYIKTLSDPSEEEEKKGQKVEDDDEYEYEDEEEEDDDDEDEEDEKTKKLKQAEEEKLKLLKEELENKVFASDPKEKVVNIQKAKKIMISNIRLYDQNQLSLLKTFLFIRVFNATTKTLYAWTTHQIIQLTDKGSAISEGQFSVQLWKPPDLTYSEIGVSEPAKMKQKMEFSIQVKKEVVQKQGEDDADDEASHPDNSKGISCTVIKITNYNMKNDLTFNAQLRNEEGIIHDSLGDEAVLIDLEGKSPNKKQSVTFMESWDISLSINQLLKDNLANYEQVYLLFSILQISQDKEKKEISYAWFLHPVFKKNKALNAGNFVKKLFKLPQKLKFPINFKQIQQLEISIEFDVEEYQMVNLVKNLKHLANINPKGLLTSSSNNNNTLKKTQPKEGFQVYVEKIYNYKQNKVKSILLSLDIFNGEKIATDKQKNNTKFTFQTEKAIQLLNNQFSIDQTFDITVNFDFSKENVCGIVKMMDAANQKLVYWFPLTIRNKDKQLAEGKVDDFLCLPPAQQPPKIIEKVIQRDNACKIVISITNNNK